MTIDDRRQFLRIVDEAVASYHLRIMALCLMGNHYHFVLETPEPQSVPGHAVHQRCLCAALEPPPPANRPRFRRRFRSLVIQRESYLIRAARYVVRNPVRAGLVDDAGAWSWSSYRRDRRPGARPALARSRLGFDGLSRRIRCPRSEQRYADYVNATVESQRPIALNGVVLGTKQFGKRLLQASEAIQPDSPGATSHPDAVPSHSPSCSTESRRGELHATEHLHCTRGARLRFHGDCALSRDRSEHRQQGRTPISMAAFTFRHPDPLDASWFTASSGPAALFTIHGLTPTGSRRVHVGRPLRKFDRAARP